MRRYARNRFWVLRNKVNRALRGASSDDCLIDAMCSSKWNVINSRYNDRHLKTVAPQRVANSKRKKYGLPLAPDGKQRGVGEPQSA